MLWKRLVTWLLNKPTTPKYRIVDRGETIQSSFLIEEGEFEGTEYLVGKVRLPTSDEPNLSFVTEILNDPSGRAETSDSFTNAAGCILQDHLRNERSDYKNWLYPKS